MGDRRLILSGHSRPVTALAFHPSSRWLASGARDITVSIWDLSDGSRVPVLEGHSGPIADLAFSADGERLFSTQKVQCLPRTRLWNWRDGHVLEDWEGCLDVAALAPTWRESGELAVIHVGESRSGEFVVTEIPGYRLVGVIPTEYGTKIHYHGGANALIGCDWRRLAVYRLITESGTGGEVDENT